jgi:hypothetical protein
MVVSIAVSLLIISVALFSATRKGWIDDRNLQRLANVAAIVALLAAVVIFVFPKQELLPDLNSIQKFPQSSIDTSSVTLTCVVWEKEKGKPIQNAIVGFIEPTGYGQKPTDSNGQVSFKLSYSGIPINAQLKIEHPDFHNITQYLNINREIGIQRFFLEKISNETKVTTKTRTCTFEGRVVDTDGNPISGVNLSIDGGRGQGISGSNGNFRFQANAPTGAEVGVLIEKEGYQSKYDYILLPGPVTIQMSPKK